LLAISRKVVDGVVLLAAGRLKQLHQVPGRISQKNLRAAGSGHDVVAELRAGGTQSCDLARKIIHNEMDAVPATSFGASAIRHDQAARSGPAGIGGEALVRRKHTRLA
jgi:hypothetical protein